jgi:formate dehydrogenase subunit gamma
VEGIKMATASRTLPLLRDSDKRITRFDVHQIIQHAGLAISFVILVLTGLPMKFHDAGISQWWAGVWGGIEVVRSVHHFFAWVMIAVCFYHLFYIIYSMLVLKRPFPIKMIPNKLDFVTFVEEIRYFLGLTKNKPKFDRFNWREKFDYFAIFWGIPVMAGSGFILMYPVLAAKYLPGWVIPAAMIAHSDEAVLALTWIAIVHIYFNHFTPGVFPINTSIITGKVSRERYSSDHALEYEILMRSEKGEEKS